MEVNKDNTEPVVNNIEHNKEVFVLQTGVEEALNIVTDIQEKDTEEEYVSDDKTVYSGWVTARVNIRKEPNTECEVLGILEFNKVVDYQLYNSEWVTIDYNGTSAYVAKKFIDKDVNKHKEYTIPDNSGFKSYMPYKSITNEATKQYKLQKSYAYTGNHGIRMVYNRYCIALGTYFDAPIGTYVDLVLENGTTISCVVAEIKSDKHTDSDNIATSHNGCVTEFLVDTKVLNESVKRHGDISSCDDNWNSPVTRIKVYKKGIL